jgi:hypothetical protein
MSDEQSLSNELIRYSDAELLQIIRVLITRLAPREGMALPSPQGRGSTVSVDRSCVVLWSIRDGEDLDPHFHLLGAIDQAHSRREFRRLLIIQPRLSFDAANSMAKRKTERLVAMLEDRRFPAAEVWAAA